MNGGLGHRYFRVLRRLLRPHAAELEERDLYEEIAGYFEMLVDRGMARGLSREEAQREARLRFEGAEHVKQRVRDARLGAPVEAAVRDLRDAVRSLRKAPGFTAFAVISIALGLGANTAMFSLVDGVMLKLPGYPQPERIVRIWEQPPGAMRNAVSPAAFVHWAKHNRTVETMAARTGWQQVTYLGHGEPRTLSAQFVSAPYFDVFRPKFALGRGFRPGEDQPGNERVAVLTHTLWLQIFDGDRSAIGRSIVLNGSAYVIVGVLAPTPAGRRSDTTEVWLPLTFPVPITSEYYYLAVFARLRDGFSVEQARAEMRTLSAGLVELYPDEKKGFSAIVDRYIDRVGPETRRPLVTLMLTAAAVLLISCANLANLLMASATGRAHELALRSALGASRGRIVRMLLMESLVLSAVGAAASGIIGYALIVGIRTTHAFGLPSDVDIAMDGRVFAFLSVATLVTCLLVGLGPAIRAAGAEPAEVLKGGLRTLSPGRRGVVARHVFVAGQVAIGFVLLAVGALLVRSLQRVNAVDVGFDAKGVLAARLPLQMGANPDPERLSQYVTRILEQVSAVPGVRATAFTSALPFEAWSDGSPFRWPGGQLQESQTTGLKVVTPGYFRTLGLRVLMGRVFDDRDRAGSPPVLIVNEHFAARFLRGKAPLGARLLMKELTPSRRGAGPEVTWEIVGIVADEKAAGLEEPDDVGAYVCFFQMPGVDADTALVTRTDVGRPGALVKPIERAIWGVNPGQAIDSPTTADDLKAQATLSRRLLTGLLGGFALLAVLLACSGLYGLLSFVTAARTKELGIRAALGATRTRLVVGVVLEGAIPVAVGLVIGLGGVITAARIVKTLLFDTSPLEPASLVGAAALFLGVAACACFVPAWRAASVSPMTTLRQQ